MPRPSRAPISLDAARAVARAIPSIDDRLVRLLPVDAITSSPQNPRQAFTDIPELADSIRTYGLLQPIVVRRESADSYILVAGHRRFAAVRALMWQEVPALIREEGAEDAYLLTLTENLQRQQLSPREEAVGLEILAMERRWSVRQIAAAIHKSPMYVSKRIRVFADEVLAAPVLAEQLPVSTAEEFLRAAKRDRADLVEQAITEEWGQMEARAAPIPASRDDCRR